eukprot:GHVR01088302.1.p1 GENE.GHVR01088302.1~~GHVR01088302.1.p1  ORF type:complete len:582 (-),score=143.52 GHVR01088302.1:57-1637(-)
MTLLRNKSNELTAEIAKFKKQIDDIHQDNTIYTNYERRFEALVKQLRSLEGDLADYNLALDKRRCDTRPEEVVQLYRILKAQNEHQRTQLDGIFLERKQQEEEINKIENEIEQIRKNNEEKLNLLLPEQREEYQKLQKQEISYEEQLQLVKNELLEVTPLINEAQHTLNNDHNKIKLQEIKEAIDMLESKKIELEKAASQRQLSIPEQRVLLMEQVKGDNVGISNMTKEIDDIKIQNEKLQRYIAEVQGDIDDTAGESKLQKYQTLFSKDEEMSVFIQNFPEESKKETDSLAEKEKNIISLLENISKLVKREQTLPTYDKVTDMKSELDFKQQQLDNSKFTHAGLKTDMEKRQMELRRVGDIEIKLEEEVQALTKQNNNLMDELQNKYNVECISNLYEWSLRERGELEQRNETLNNRIDLLKQHYYYVKLYCDTKWQQVQDNDTHVSLESIETKLRQSQQNVYHLEVYVEGKKRETSSEALRFNILNLTQKLNSMLIKSLQGSMSSFVPGHTHTHTHTSSCNISNC